MHEKIKVPLSSFKAAIFDMDGTMIQNSEHHKKAWQEFLRKHDVAITDDEFRYRVVGLKNDQILEAVFGKKLEPDEIRTYAEEKESIYRELYAPDIKEVDGLTDIISQLHAFGLKMAIATTAPEKNRSFTLNGLHLETEFEVILGDEHVTHGKPDPEIYLATANKLGVRPDECLVFEDSPPGVASAKQAGMTVVGLLTSHTTEELIEADYTIHNFRAIEFI